MHRVVKNICLLLCIAVTFAFSASCSRYDENTFFALDTLIYFKTDSELPNGVAAFINEYEKRLSRIVNGSYISNLNAGIAQADDEEINELIKSSVELGKSTEGAFDITCGALAELWNIKSDEPRVPSDTEISDVLKNVGYEKLTFTSSGIDTNGAVIDLGGIAKGYIAQKTVEYLKQNGVTSGVASFGGNIAVIGAKQNGDGWRIGIKDPENTSKTVGTLALTAGYVSVSGGYERYFEKDGVRYHHIFDRKTGMPADSDILSVAVIADDGTLADALSTALFVMGADKAMSFYESGEYDFEAVIVKNNGVIYISDELADVFTLDSNKYKAEYFGG